MGGYNYELFCKNCSECHKEPLFSDYSFRNNGLESDPQLKDIGRMKVTQNRMDSLKFKVPSLRNIEKTAPYFHDGSVESLEDAVIIMAKTQLNKELTPEEVFVQKYTELNYKKEELTDVIDAYHEILNQIREGE